MEVWTLDQMTDPEFKKMLSQNIDGISGLVDLQMSDGTIRVSKRQAFLNLFWWPILTAFNIPLRKDHFIKNKAYSASSLYEEWNRYYDEIMGITSHNAKLLKQTMWNVLEDMYYFGCIDLAEYVASLDIVDMSEITTEPVMDNIIKTKYDLVDANGDLKPYLSTKNVEEIIARHGKEIIKLLETKGALQNQRLLPFQRTGQLNVHQVPQTMYCFGIRTDINDAIVKMVVIGSALDGLRNIHEFADEALSARKTAFYNHEAVKQSQYFNRRMQLVCSSVRQLYEGDCGSTVTVSYRIKEKTKNNVIGKHVIDNGKIICLTKDNIDNYVDKIVQIRSAMTCRYRNGVCEVCGGRIYSNFNPKLNPGIISSIHTVESVTQKILSAKHLVKTMSIIYRIPISLEHIFEARNTSEIAWHKDFIGKWQSKKFDPDLKLGVPYDSFRNFTDVKLIRGDSVCETSMSNLDTIYIRKGDTVIIEANMKNDKDNMPSFSIDMLRHIRNNFNSLEHKNGCIWIPMAGTEHMSLMVTKIMNDNMLAFVQRVDTFFKTDIKKFRTNSAALEAATDLLYDKVSVNITHIETVLKAFQIVSDSDRSIPRVEDTNDVQYRGMDDILEYRHVGSKLAYEDLKNYIYSPETYLNARQKSVFDFMIGYIQ